MDMSFSSDTGMAECLVIARKGSAAKSPHVHTLSTFRVIATSVRGDFAEANTTAKVN